ncbi:hypothetical protein D4A59_00990, partial [Campylobacter jejuni]|nr:hypothetical protein [Campylobacter jejuni]
QKYPLSGFVDIKDIKIFSQKYTYAANKNKNDEKLSKNSYLELSKGEFKNCFKDKKLFKKFEDLRELIKKGSNLD